MKRLLIFCISIFTALMLTNSIAETIPSKTPYPEIQSNVITRTTDKPKRTIKATYPVFTMKAGAAKQVNGLIKIMVNKRIQSFVEQSTNQVEDFTSSLDINYNVMYFIPKKMVSIQFKQYQYFSGAAHPNMTTFVINYDLAKGQLILLIDVVTHPIKGLQFIANYAMQQLKKRDLGDATFLEAGARADFKNYKNWNFTKDGMLITFDPYQVAAYVYGTQAVTIPYAVLQNHLRKYYFQMVAK